jgi:hypothetical protein
MAGIALTAEGGNKPMRFSMFFKDADLKRLIWQGKARGYYVSG